MACSADERRRPRITQTGEGGRCSKSSHVEVASAHEAPTETLEKVKGLLGERRPSRVRPLKEGRMDGLSKCEICTSSGTLGQARDIGQLPGLLLVAPYPPLSPRSGSDW